MNLIKRFLKTSSVYFLGKALSFVVSFLMLRIYTSHISAESYGRYDLVVSVIDFIVPFVFVEIWSGMLRRVLFHDRAEDKKKAVSTSMMMLLVCLPLYTAIFWGIAVCKNFDSRLLIYVYSISYMLYSYSCILARALGRNKLFALSGIIGSISNAVVGLISVYVLHLQDQTLFLAVTANYLIQFLLITVRVKAWTYFSVRNFDKGEFRALCAFCFPLALNTLVNYAYTGFYKTVVNSQLGADMLGLFSVSIKFAGIITFVGQIFHLAWQELSYSISQNNSKIQIYSIGINFFSGFLLIGCAAILPVIKVLFPLTVGAEFAEAAALVPYYYLYVYFYMINGFLYNILSAENKTNMLFVGKLIGTVVLLGLLSWLIRPMRLAAVPICIVIASMAEYLFVRGYTHFKIGVSYKNISLISVLVLYLAGTVVYSRYSVGINVLWLAAVLVISVALVFYDNREILEKELRSLRRKG